MKKIPLFLLLVLFLVNIAYAVPTRTFVISSTSRVINPHPIVEAKSLPNPHPSVPAKPIVVAQPADPVDPNNSPTHTGHPPNDKVHIGYPVDNSWHHVPATPGSDTVLTNPDNDDDEPREVKPIDRTPPARETRVNL